MPAEAEAATGVSAIVQDAPPSVVRRTRQRVEAPVPIHAWSRPNTATLVPLPAKAPSFESAGGNLSGGTRTHVFPPSLVVRMSNLPSTESPITSPRPASQNAIASKNAFGL